MSAPERKRRRWIETPGGVASALNRYDDFYNPEHDRPTRSEQSLEGTAVNGPIPVGQEDEL